MILSLLKTFNKFYFSRDNLSKTCVDKDRELAHLEKALQDEQRTKQELNRQVDSSERQIEKLASDIESLKRAKNEDLINFQKEEEAWRKRIEDQRSKVSL